MKTPKEVKDYRTRMSCPECRGRTISNHYGKFKCHKCGYVAYYDSNGKEEKGKIVWW